MIKKYLFSLFLTVVVSQFVFAQQSEHPGVALYKAGKYAEAANALQISLTSDKTHRSDAGIWNYLGLSHLALQDFKSARKAFEKAVDLSPTTANYHINLGYAWLMMRNIGKAKGEANRAIQADPANVSAHYLRASARLIEGDLDDAKKDADRVLDLDPTFSQGYVLQSEIMMARFSNATMGDGIENIRNNLAYLSEARDVLRSGLEKAADRDAIEKELNGIDAFYDYLSKEPPVPSTQPSADHEPGVTPLKVLAKPPARYTDRARQANIQGFIRIAVLFGATGRIEHLLVLKRLGHGLDEEAMAAARRIKFEPKQKDGTPVSTVKVLEYHFSIY